MLEVQSVCDRVLFLSRGKVLLQGDPRTLPQAHGEAGLEELFIRIAREPLRHVDPPAPAVPPAHAGHLDHADPSPRDAAR
jgi:ABC-2 type transport system ATP-binding protein